MVLIGPSSLLPQALTVPKLQGITKKNLDDMLVDLNIVNYGNRMHALAGTKPGKVYKFSKDKAKHLHSNVSPAIMSLGEEAMSVFGKGTSNAMNFTDCVFTAYSHGGFVGSHNDKDHMCRHFNILSLSFGHTATMIINGHPIEIANAQAIIFDGRQNHCVEPLKGQWRYNFSFRSWN